MKAAPVQQRRLADDIVDRIETLILEGTLKPGERLPAERALAEEFGVSRPSLREALQKLVARGLLQSRHGGGTFVSEALGVLSNIVQVVSLVGLLVFIEPLVLLVAVVFAAPYLRFHWRLATHHYAVEHSRATKRRWSEYFVSLLSGRASVAEVRMLGLAPTTIEAGSSTTIASALDPAKVSTPGSRNAVAIPIRISLKRARSKKKGSSLRPAKTVRPPPVAVVALAPAENCTVAASSPGRI